MRDLLRQEFGEIFRAALLGRHDFEAELLEYFGARHSSLLSDIVSTGTVDADALEAGIKAFAAQFQTAAQVAAGEEPGGGAADATTTKVTAPTHLPEDEITLVEDEG